MLLRPSRRATKSGGNSDGVAAAVLVHQGQRDAASTTTAADTLTEISEEE